MNRIKDLRAERRITQSKLGQALGCTTATVSKYELEQRQLDPATINALCDFFGVTSDYLLCRSNVPNASLTESDAALIAAYHSADENIRKAIDALLFPAVEPEGKSAVS